MVLVAVRGIESGVFEEGKLGRAGVTVVLQSTPSVSYLYASPAGVFVLTFVGWFGVLEALFGSLHYFGQRAWIFFPDLRLLGLLPLIHRLKSLPKCLVLHPQPISRDFFGHGRCYFEPDRFDASTIGLSLCLRCSD